MIRIIFIAAVGISLLSCTTQSSPKPETPNPKPETRNPKPETPNPELETLSLMETNNPNPYYSRTDTTKLNVSDAEWKKILPDSIYKIAREAGTEYPFTGKYWNYEGLGTYYCVVCGNKLFKSDAKFASSCGWPSFFETVRKNSVIYHQDNTHGMSRIEVVCGRCESHLGHVFDDGPKPTGLRYCMNSVMLDFEPDK